MQSFVDVFSPPDRRLMCCFHVLTNLEKYLKPLKKGAAKLFIQTWRNTEYQCILYFLMGLLSHSINEGAISGYLSANNWVRNLVNAVIKRECTLRKRSSVGQFLNVALISISEVV